jgi:hypothetical protein
MPHPNDAAVRFLRATAIAWFVAAALGQLMFCAYMAGFYGPTIATGDFVQWTREKNLIHGYRAGDMIGNVGFISHVALGFVVTICGLLQMIPLVRRRAPVLHRWSGRAFLVSVCLAAIGGLALVWLRGTQAGLSNALAISLNGVLILLFAPLALRAALQRNFAAHQAWAFRLWLVASGVWFLRIGMAAYAMIGFGALGLKDIAMGAWFAIWGFGCLLAPLALYELYRAAQVRAGAAAWTMGGLMIVLTLLTALGSLGVTIGQWLPMILAPPLA